MKKAALIFSVSLMLLFPFICTAPPVSAFQVGPTSRESPNHTDWIAKSLKKIRNIKVGMTRKDLLDLFQTEGGIFTRTSRKYVFRECPYIKVDVEFEPVGSPEDNLTEFSDDKIIKISKPYLEKPIID